MKTQQWNPLNQLFLSLLVLLMASCASTTSSTLDPAGSSENAALRSVAGNWRFVNAGTPNISTEGMPDPVKMINQTMKGATMRIRADGTSTVDLWDWESPEFTFRIQSEDDQVIRLTADGMPNGEYFTYEKRRKRLVQNVSVKVNGREGKLPAYYKRVR